MDRPSWTSDAGGRDINVEHYNAPVEGESTTADGVPMPTLQPVPTNDPVKACEARDENYRRMTEWLDTQPIRYTGPWTRDELYER